MSDFMAVLLKASKEKAGFGIELQSVAGSPLLLQEVCQRAALEVRGARKRPRGKAFHTFAVNRMATRGNRAPSASSPVCQQVRVTLLGELQQRDHGPRHDVGGPGTERRSVREGELAHGLRKVRAQTSIDRGRSFVRYGLFGTAP
ncbi:hypothetical protein [Trinickia symbiotica]|uniref:hypothetical protein n=1 Tax=Trinickia symbiotica TaxID=863227 RepID=UPI0011B1E35F|nr:hypothetical protein [Trinickia symbiotica]